MFEKLFDYALNYVNKAEKGQRLRMLITLSLYAIVLIIAIYGAMWGLAMVIEHFKLYQYIPLWAYKYPFLFMKTNM